MTPSATWSYPTHVRFGAGRIAELGDAARTAGMARPLLVTDRGLAGMSITARALDAMEGAGLGRAAFAGVDPNPTGANLDAGVAAYREGGHDGVVAFGGGSALDLGKTVAFMAGQTRPVWDFEDLGDNWTRADAAAIAPVIAVPTTAGTGSEVGRAGVITDEASHEKKIIFHPGMLPRAVIADPELTVGLPPALTAGTGLDAFAHCVEAYSSPHFHPMSHGIALEGMRLVIAFLPRAFRDGADLEARAQMMAAAMMGAVAFQKGLGAIHALSHPVGAVHGTHHGTTNAVCMPAVLDFNAPAIAERFDRAAGYLGVEGGFDGFRAFVRRFNDRLGVPERLSGLGVRAPDLDALTEAALRDPSVGGNPVEMTRETTRALFERVL
jgi:alcohol dehydrogenase class IV